MNNNPGNQQNAQQPTNIAKRKRDDQQDQQPPKLVRVNTTVPGARGGLAPRGAPPGRGGPGVVNRGGRGGFGGHPAPTVNAAVQRQLQVVGLAEQGDYDAVLQQFHWAHTLPNPQRTNTLRSWLDAIFASQTAINQLDLPSCAMIVKECGYTVSRSGGALHDNWFDQKLTQLGPATAAAKAVLLENWASELCDSPALVRWLVRSLDRGTLDDADAGLAARLFNMLWNGGHFQAICDLCDAGIDTLQATYDTTKHVGPPPEGVYSGYVQPLEHILGSYIGPARYVELEATLNPRQKHRLNGARQVLTKLTQLAQGDPERIKILTNFDEVLGSPAIRLFRTQPGMIWGFESVRKAYVQAAHLMPEGQRPIRMMEIWSAVRPALNQQVFAALMQHPDIEILKLATFGLQDTTKHLQRHPEDFALLNMFQFAPKFVEDAMSYLDFMSRRAPDFKHRTAEERGHTMSAYEAAYGCKLGLWWAEHLQQPVYYCLDGLRMEDATDYKKDKTDQINAFLNNDPDSRAFSEVITLAELRVIFKDWGKFSKIVRFVEKGKVLDATDPRIATWIADMKQADGDAKERLAPPMQVTEKELAMLLEPATIARIKTNLPTEQAEADVEVKAIADQLYFAWLAATAKHEVLIDTFKKTPNLFATGVLPNSLPTDFQNMVADQNPVTRQQRATNLKVSINGVDPRLRAVLVEAVDRFTSPASTPPKNQNI